MRFFIILFILICAEVTLIAKVGSMIGFFYTFFLIILTAVIGSWQLKKQWRFVIGKMQTLQSEPSDGLLEAFILLMSGVLLIAPGFLTDTVGFLGLIPVVRESMVIVVKKHFSKISSASFQRFKAQNKTQNSEQNSTDSHHTPNVIEGEFERQDDKPN